MLTFRVVLISSPQQPYKILSVPETAPFYVVAKHVTENLFAEMHPLNHQLKASIRSELEKDSDVVIPGSLVR